jgi:hypothetical protein
MRSGLFRTAVLALFVLTTSAIGPAALAQDASPGAMAEHPLVGAWLLDTSGEETGNPSSDIIFHADGTYVESDVDGVGIGSWEPTGDQTGAATFLFHQAGEDGAISTVKIRATVEVAADGLSFTATYTLEFVGADGTSSGELGPGTATGTRITVEPEGTPVGPLGPPPGASPGPGGASPTASESPGP